MYLLNSCTNELQVAFGLEHDRLFLEAKTTNDYSQVTKHYYSVMSAVVDEYFGGNFHFAPPETPGQNRAAAMRSLHHRIGQMLKLETNLTCLDVGCGVGGLIQDLAPTGATLTGITIADNEVIILVERFNFLQAEIGNERFRQSGIDDRCRILVADCHHIPLPDETFDCAYAVYALKYFTDVKPVLAEIARVLRPGGRLLIYDLIKTGSYDADNSDHRRLIEGLEYACGMPSLHTREQMIETATQLGLRLETCEDLAQFNGYPYYACFTESPLLMWLMRSRAAKALISVAQALSILPKGFQQFNDTFLSGTVTKIVDGGTKGILSGSEIFLFQKMGK